MKNYEFTVGREISGFKLKVSLNRSKSLRHNFVSKISSGVKECFGALFRVMGVIAGHWRAQIFESWVL